MSASPSLSSSSLTPSYSIFSLSPLVCSHFACATSVSSHRVFMTSQPGRSTSNGRSTSAVSFSPSFTSSSPISRRASSQTPSSSSSTPVSRSPSSSVISITPSSTRPQPISISSSFSVRVNARPSTSLPRSSSASIADSHSQATPVTHRPCVIAAIAVSTSASSQTPSSTPISPEISTTSSSTGPQSISISSSFSINALPSTSLPQNSSVSIADSESQSRVTLLSHRPGVIGAIAVFTVVAVLLLSSLVFFLYRRRRRIQQMQVVRNERISAPFMQEYPRNTEAKGWASPSSTCSGSGWPADVSGPASRTISMPFPLRVDRPRRQSATSLAGSAKASHYTVRSHTSHVMGETHSFGKDVAWKEAHYENLGPLPIFRDRPSSSQRERSRSAPLHPEKKINLTAQTPTSHSGVAFHPNNNTDSDNVAPSKTPMWLLRRSTASASSVSSEYSTDDRPRSLSVV
ncbi:hypothetical protein MVEN_00628000 [Mycena venus]|uniref:Uncharacterized protein n=1 Tax=Mycena venus TaxID=2733690 RepID=A0A8H6YMP1_9AGAR|nr:hypothetical protein MVEN_00628000 [Mycena venus]